MNKDHQRIKELFRQLKAKQPELFPQERRPLNVTTKHGVYIIYSPGRKILHVGRTLRGRKGLRQRLNNHLQGQSSFTVSYFKNRKKSPKLLRRRYKFAYVEVNNSRMRALLEAYAVGMLCPIHLGTGEISA